MSISSCFFFVCFFLGGGGGGGGGERAWSKEKIIFSERSVLYKCSLAVNIFSHLG